MDALKIIGATKAVIDGLKTLNDYAEDIEDTQKRGEFMRIIGNLSTELAETQIKLAAQIRENNELQEKVRLLQKEVENLKNPDLQLRFENGYYYEKDGKHPFCTACYDSQKKAIRLTLPSRILKQAQGAKYVCPICNALYTV
jgi:hypothetical protein